MGDRLDAYSQIIIDNNTDKELVDLYFTYEFSDHVICLRRDNPACATIWGLVDSGKLSVQEAVEALSGCNGKPLI